MTTHAVTLNMPPAWVQVSDDVTASMGRIREKISLLSSLHAKALLPTFDDNAQEDAQVNALTQEITRLFKKCEQKLQALTKANPGDEADAKVRQNVVRSMAAELQKHSMEFRRKQKDYLQKLKQTQDRGPGGGIFGEVGDEEGGGDAGFNESQASGKREGAGGQAAAMPPPPPLALVLPHCTLRPRARLTRPPFAAQMLRTNTLIDEVVARDAEVVKVIESVNELASIMKDLSVLVIDQGTILDRIDYNINQTSESVKKAVVELEHAETTQKKNWMLMARKPAHPRAQPRARPRVSRPRLAAQIISLLLVLVILMIVIITGRALISAG